MPNVLDLVGTDFAFVARQKRITVDDVDYYLDLLFYHLKLRCYVVVELKAGAFKPEHAGQLNFYLNVVDSLVKTAHENPTIGLLLCKTKNRVVAEYALRDASRPIGVAEYQLVAFLNALRTSVSKVRRRSTCSGAPWRRRHGGLPQAGIQITEFHSVGRHVP